MHFFWGICKRGIQGILGTLGTLLGQILTQRGPQDPLNPQSCSLQIPFLLVISAVEYISISFYIYAGLGEPIHHPKTGTGLQYTLTDHNIRHLHTSLEL